MNDNLNHYRDMLESVQVVPERKEMILKNAMGQAIVKRKKIKRAAAMCLVFVLIVGSLGSGVAYATTGKTPVELIRQWFYYADDEYAMVLGQEFAEPNESQVVGNWKITLQRYWFDEEEATMIAEVACESLDGGPLVSKEIRDICQRHGFDPDQLWQLQASFFEFGRIRSDVKSEGIGKKIWLFEGYAGMDSEDAGVEPQLTIWNGLTTQKVQFSLENTGTLKSRELDSSTLTGCEEMELNALRLKWIMKEPMEDPIVELCMKDGSSRVLKPVGNGEESMIEEGVETVSYGEQILETEEGIRYGYVMDLDWSLYDPDKIEKIIVNGTEILFQEK